LRKSFGVATLGILFLIASSIVLPEHSAAQSTNAAGPDPNAQAEMFMAKAALDNSDLYLTIVSDSTCFSYGYRTYPKVAVHRWCLVFVSLLAEKLPAYTVKYRQWNYGNGAGPPGANYDPWATIQVGSGTRTLWVSNASFPGATTYEFLTGRFQAAIEATTPDLVIVSTGHNFPWNCPDCWPNLILDLTESITLAFPSAGIILVGQNPTELPYPYATTTPQKVAAVQNVAQSRGYEFINSYEAFLSSGYPLANLLLPDGVHPTSPESQVGLENGSHLWATNVAQYFVDCLCNVNLAQQPSTLAIAGKQLLTNGTFEDYPDGALTPTGWQAEGGVTVTKDTSFFSNENGYSVHLSSNNVPGWISRSLDVNSVAGQCVTLAAREYVAAGMPDTAGRLSIFDNVSPPDTNDVLGMQSGDWRWLSVTHCFAANITSAGVSIYADSASSDGAVSIDKACLTAGHDPHTCPMGLTVTAENATRSFGRQNPTFGGAIAGLRSGDNITATYSSVANSTSPPGSYPIVPTLIDPNAKLGDYTVTLYDGVLTVSQVTPSLATSSPLSSLTTQSVSVGVTVSGGAGSPTPTGTITLMRGGYTSRPATLIQGKVSISIQAGSLKAGSDPLVATYMPDAASSSWYEGTSVSVPITVSLATPTVTVSPVLSNLTTAQDLTVTVAVNGGSGAPIPSGTVTLGGGGYISTPTMLSGGGAALSIPAGKLSTGADTLTVSYAPDSPSSSIYSNASGSIPVTVTAAPASFAISATAVTILPGASSGNTSTITVKPEGGFVGIVSLAAVVTSGPNPAQDPPILSLGSSSVVSIKGTRAATATLTISTTPGSRVALFDPKRAVKSWYMGAASLACILIFGLKARRRRWQTLLTLLACLGVLPSAMLGCGFRVRTMNPGTTSGTYIVTVTGSSGATTASAKVAVTVQ